MKTFKNVNVGDKIVKVYHLQYQGGNPMWHYTTYTVIGIKDIGNNVSYKMVYGDKRLVLTLTPDELKQPTVGVSSLERYIVGEKEGIKFYNNCLKSLKQNGRS